MTGAQLRQHRERMGLSQSHLALRLGVTANTIARWERGAMRIQHPAIVALAMQRLEQERSSQHPHNTP